MHRVAVRPAEVIEAMTVAVTEVVSVVRRAMVPMIRTAVVLPRRVRDATLLLPMTALRRAARAVPTPGSLRAAAKVLPVVPKPHLASRLAAPRCSYRVTR
jgi:hypothetical protein